MPVWHDKAQRLVDAGKLAIVGLAQEQHPDRCRLFLQWHKIDWPMMWDPINTTGQSAVPIITAIDEHGIVRLTRPNPETIERDFLDKSYPWPDAAPDLPITTPPSAYILKQKAMTSGDPADWLRLADAEVLRGAPESAIPAYRRTLGTPPDARAHFRLGVCYRMRFDSPRRQPGDFQKALDEWQNALDLDPNQYIWRRRIQQYGPRLEKPYPFYDWVAKARADIRARGDTPVPLTAEPTGAEIAAPIRTFAAAAAATEPDPKGRITRDAGAFIHVETAVAPARLKPGATARIHLIFRPNKGRRAHWNNEAEPLRVWVTAPQGWSVDVRLIELTNPKTATSTETREANFEVRAPQNAPPSKVPLSVYALYNVCEDTGGQCLFRRQDVVIPLEIDRRGGG